MVEPPPEMIGGRQRAGPVMQSCTIIMERASRASRSGTC
jgi:hypothetical protein